MKFDEASVALGDEMRAARAHLGRSIDDVEAALKIKAKYIDAIENCDRSLLPERAYADGFIKTYARYLGLDPDETLARFERDSAAISAAREEPKRGRKAVAAANVGTYTPTHDPLAAYDRRVGVGSAIGRGFRLILSLWPLALLAAIIFGVWYGVRAARDAGMIPENISIIGEAEEVRPIFEANIADGNLGGTEPATLVERPSELSYANLGVVPYWHTPSFDVPSQDGPIEEINAETAGVFSPRIVPEINTDLRHTSARNGPFPFDAREIAAEARAALTAEMLRGAHHQAGRDAQREVEVAALDGAQVIDTTTTQAATPGAIIPADPSTVALVARADTWIEIRDPLGAVTYTGVLSSGETVPIDSSAGLKVKIGNAGGLYVRMGALEYGPFGGSGVVMRNVQLDRPSILSRFGATVTQ